MLSLDVHDAGSCSGDVMSNRPMLLGMALCLVMSLCTTGVMSTPSSFANRPYVSAGETYQRYHDKKTERHFVMFVPPLLLGLVFQFNFSQIASEQS